MLRALALLVLAASTLPLVPTGAALDVGCVETPAGEPARVVALPASLFLGWTPECVIVRPGVTVLFSNLDATAKAVLFPTCEQARSPILASGEEWSISFGYDPATDALTALDGEDTRDCARPAGPPEHRRSAPWHDPIQGPLLAGRVLVRTH